jgi:GNAT superfamily N-acetyltransferase
LIDVKRISTHEFFNRPETGAMLAEYAKESRIPGMPAPAPNAAQYHNLNASGLLHVLGAFTPDGTRVGFLTLLVYLNPHYSRVLAVLESIFVVSEHRSGGAGSRLLLAAQDMAEQDGAIGLLVSAPASSRLEQVMRGLKSFTLSNVVFFKPLAGGES